MAQQVQSQRAIEKLGPLPVGPAFDGFAVFAVGGAVRDALRGKTPTDIDLMAVPKPGHVDHPAETLAARDEMTPIEPTSSFPVFLDGEGREVALPRTEKSTGAGFRAFDVSLVSPDVPVRKAVETDLRRRDLTINAMAFDLRAGQLIDPFDGAEDLRSGLLRPVSEAFSEDPIRVLRMARFAASLGFSVRPDDREAPREAAPDLRAVPGERIAIELRKTLKRAENAGMFVRWLDRFEATRFAFPEFADVDREKLADTLDELDTMAARLVAIGWAVSSNRLDRFVERLGLSSAEEKTLRLGDRHVQEVVEVATISDPNDGARAAMEVADLVDGRGIDTTEDDLLAFAETIDGVRDFDRERAETRIAGIREAREQIDAERMFTRLRIDASDLNDPDTDIDGPEFGRKLRFAQQSLVAASERMG